MLDERVASFQPNTNLRPASGFWAMFLQQSTAGGGPAVEPRPLSSGPIEPGRDVSWSEPWSIGFASFLAGRLIV